MTGILFLNGIFNRMFLSIPIFEWIIIAMLLFGIILILLFYVFFWYRLQPYHGLLRSTINRTGASFVFDENMHFDFITDRGAKVIFSETLKQAQEAEGDNTEVPAATVGTVRSDFVFDPDKWTYPDSPQRAIIFDVAERYNEIHPDDQVRTFHKFARLLHNTYYPTDDNAPHFDREEVKDLRHEYVVPWSRIRMMYRMRDEGSMFGFVGSLAKLINDIEKTNMNNLGYMVLGCSFAMDLVIIFAWFLTRKPA